MIDYGNEATVSIRDVKCMIHYFEKCMPQMALPCGDSNAPKIDPDIFKAKLEGRNCAVKVGKRQMFYLMLLRNMPHFPTFTFMFKTAENGPNR